MRNRWKPPAQRCCALHRAMAAACAELFGLRPAKSWPFEVLPPILADLQAAHPELDIELVPSNRVKDLLRRDADIAVRMQRPAQGVLIARHIGGIELGVYAHRRYLRRKGMPTTLDDLASHALIGYD